MQWVMHKNGSRMKIKGEEVAELGFTSILHHPTDRSMKVVVMREEEVSHWIDVQVSTSC